MTSRATLQWQEAARRAVALGRAEVVDDGYLPVVVIPGSTPAFGHELFVYQGVPDLLDGCVRFLDDAREARRPALVALTSDKLGALEDRGVSAAEVRLVPMETVGRNPGRILAMWRDFVAASAPRPVCGIGEPIWAGRTADELVECQLHEELLNHAFDVHTPLRLRCPYDASALSAEVIDSAFASHPLVWEHGAASAHPRWRATPPGDLLRRPLSEPATDSTSWIVRNVLLTELRGAVAARATDAGLDEGRAAEVVLVTDELAANGLHHGRSDTVRVAMWTAGGHLVVEVVDGGGHLADPLVGRTRPTSNQLRGRGLFIGHHLADLLQLRSDGATTTVRASFALA